jgi:1-acyl-sn-glycerol-3-phosphate acyltransferase
LALCRRPDGPDWGSGWLNCLDRLNQWFCRRYHRLSFNPIPLPAAGPAVVVANHVSGLDALLMVAASARPLRFIIAREEYQRFGLTWVFRAIGCIPVERERRPQAALLNAMRALEAGEVVAVFPEGRFRAPNERPGPLKGGAVWLAQAVACPIYPVRIEGIGRPGHILGALVRRSRARLTSLSPLSCNRLTETECLNRLSEVLFGVPPD